MVSEDGVVVDVDSEVRFCGFFFLKFVESYNFYVCIFI